MRKRCFSMKENKTAFDEVMEAIFMYAQPTMEVLEEQPEEQEDEENLVARVISELSEIRGEKVDISRPNDVAEFLCPAKDFGKEDKISLYDLLNYLTSPQRGSFLQSIAYDIPYFLEKSPMNNKYKALARLECQMLNITDEEILYYLEHDEYEGNGVLPEVLCDKVINDYLVNQDEKETAYIRGLFQDKKINRMVSLVSYNKGEMPKQFHKDSSN